MVDIDYLEEERKKLWGKIVELENDLRKRSPDHEIESRNASKKASEFRNKCEESKNIAQASLELVKNEVGNINEIKSNLLETVATIEGYKQKSEQLNESVFALFEKTKENFEGFEEKNDELNRIYSEYNVYVQRVKELDAILTQGADYSTKVDAVYKSIVSRKGKIDEIYYDIFGYTEENDGKEVTIDGVKDKLENAYEDLEVSIESSKQNIKVLNESVKSEYSTFIDSSKENLNEIIKNWQSEIYSIKNRIKELLPDALTTGLSHAYSEKRKNEIIESAKYDKTFSKSIIGLIVVSVIPFLVSVDSLLNKVSLEDIILRLPRLVLAIIPLYVPVLWVAYSANRKSNLSKRLIEEYTHKEVLSKTFEGLSSQISSIEDKDISSELRTKLLFNILEVSSENPGKLISDYNKSDHPLMDALDKSVKLANAVEKLGKIPGFSKLAASLDAKAKSLLVKEKEKAELALVANEEELQKVEEHKTS